MSLGMLRRAAVISGMLGVLLFVVVLAAPGQAGAHTDGLHVTLCHATGSAANPYTAVTVDINSVADAQNAGGHGDHNDDVIPSYTFGGYTYPGKNLDVLATLNPTTCNSLPPTSTTSTSTSTTSMSSSTSTSSTSTSTSSTSTTSTTLTEPTTVVTEGTTATTSTSTSTPTTEVSTTTSSVLDATTIAPTSTVSPGTQGSTVARSTTTTTTHATGSSTLPFTGGSTGPLAMLGAGICAAGIMLVRVRRRAIS